MKKRILLIHHGKGLGGGLVALLGIIQELKSDYNISVFTIFNSEANDYIRREGVTLIENNSFYYQKIYRIFSHSAAAYDSILRLILKFYNLANFIFNKYIYTRVILKNLIGEFDIVYLNSTFISDWAYFPKKLNKKVIIHVREPLRIGNFDFFSKIIRSNISEFCDKIISISNDNAQRIGIPHKTSVIYDPVVTNLSESNIHPVLEKKYKYFAYLGGAARIKGFEQMVNSLDLLADDIKVFFLGNYTPVKKIDKFYRKQKELLIKMKKSEKSIFVGKTNNVIFYLKSSVANISPFSKPHAALPILESFSLGIPVIVSDIDGMDELVTNGENGMIFANNNSADLAAKINFLAKIKEEELALFRNYAHRKYTQIRNSSETLIETLKSTN